MVSKEKLSRFGQNSYSCPWKNLPKAKNHSTKQAYTETEVITLFQYTVRPGDTLSSIAAYFDVSPAAILAENFGLRPHHIIVGQRIFIPISPYLYQNYPWYYLLPYLFVQYPRRYWDDRRRWPRQWHDRGRRRRRDPWDRRDGRDWDRRDRGDWDWDGRDRDGRDRGDWDWDGRDRGDWDWDDRDRDGRGRQRRGDRRGPDGPTAAQDGMQQGVVWPEEVPQEGLPPWVL